jgi:hypothetical protein
MSHIAAGLFASIGLAIVITALVAPHRQSPQVISATLGGLTNLSRAAVGN